MCRVVLGWVVEGGSVVSTMNELSGVRGDLPATPLCVSALGGGAPLLTALFQ